MLSYAELYQRKFVRDPYSFFLGEKSFELMKATERPDGLNDRILSQEIYGDDENYDNFRKLKSRFNKRIMDELFFNISERFNPKERNDFAIMAMKQYITSLVLKHTSLNDVYVKIAEKLIKQAKNYDFAFLISMLSSDLHSYYAFVNPNTKLMLRYRKIMEDSGRDYQFISKTMIINGEISNIYINHKLNPKREQLERVKELCEVLKGFQKQTTSYDIHSFGYDLRAYPLVVENKYEELLRLMIEAEEYFKAFPFSDKAMNWTIQLYRLMAYLFLGKINDAIYMCEHLLSWLTFGNRFWLLINHYYFIANSVKGNFQKCVDIIETIFSSKALNAFPNEKPIWELRMAYFSINKDVLELKLNANTSVKYITSAQFFRRNKQLLQDKRSMNLPFRIIEIFYLIERNNFNRVIDIIESLSQFKYRYLRDDETFRSQCFIRLLEVMSKCSFHPVRTKAHAAPILNKMSKKDVIIENENIFPEILPYEQVWNLLMIKISK